LGLKNLLKTCRFVARSLFTAGPRIGYIGGYQHHANLGDEALYAALKRLFYSGSFIDYNRGFVPHNLVRHLPKCNLMLMGGGTIIGGHKESAYQWAKTCFALAPHNIVFGSGVVSPEFMSAVLKQPVEIQKQWADIIKSCDYVGVRGPLSRKILEDWGIPDAEVIGDPVLTLARGEMPDGRLADDKLIGFNVGQSRGNVWGSEQHICEQFVKLAQIAGKVGFRIRWFVVWPEDLPVTQRVVHDTGLPADICEFYDDYNGYMDAVSSVNVFIGIKLHATALATCAFVPSVMLEYNPKCRDYMESIGQGENSLRTDRFAAEKVWEMTENLLANRSIISRRLFEEITKFHKLQSLRASEICAKLGLKPTVD
jgi:polysaccharide pyruvyl transferase WcaK-like protein